MRRKHCDGLESWFVDDFEDSNDEIDDKQVSDDVAIVSEDLFYYKFFLHRTHKIFPPFTEHVTGLEC